MADERRRVWAFIVWQESAPDHWVEMIERWGIHAIISPLHDRDVWSELDAANNPNVIAGEAKKPHYHVMIFFDNATTQSDALRMVQTGNGSIDGMYGFPFIKWVEPVRSTNAYTRYLCHLDHPAKAQYDTDEIVALNGALVDLDKAQTEREVDEIFKAIEDYIDDNGILEYSDASRIFRAEYPQWYNVFRHNTMHFKTYLNSKRNKLRETRDAMRAADEADAKC